MECFSLRATTRFVSLIALYAVTGKLGLWLASAGGGYAAPVWAPSGLAIAAAVVWGRRYLAAVWIGAFIVNFGIRGAIDVPNVALGMLIATGNTLEALVAEYFLNRVYRFTPSFERLSNSAAFIFISIVAPMVSATIGIGSVALVLGRSFSPDVVGSWLVWWLGDALGVFVFAPVAIAFATKPRQQHASLEFKGAIAYPAAMALICFIGMGWFSPPQLRQLLPPFIVSTILIWCALVMTDRWFFFSIAVLTSVRIVFAYFSLGPFSLMGDMLQRLIVLQSFLGCTLPTLLVLRAVVAERLSAVELAKARESAMIASEKMSALGQFTSGIAHEISNPLTVIYGKAAAARDRVESGTPDLARLKADIEKIEAMAGRIEKIVKAVRFFSRASERDPHRLTSVKSIVEDTVDLCNQHFEKKQVELIIEPIAAELQIECEPVQVAQVLLNLLYNAFTAAAATDGPNRWVRLSARAVDGSAEFAVSDSGPGVPVALRKKIFLPFFTTKKPGEGTGLGLSVARTIVEAHNGTIDLDTTSANTRFAARFPLSQ